MPCISGSRELSSSCVSAGQSSHHSSTNWAPVYLENLHNYCIRGWSCLNPLGQQQRPCQAVNQTQTWWSRLLCRRTPRVWNGNGISCRLTSGSKPSWTLVFLGANSFVFVSTPLVHTNIVVGYWSFVGGNIWLD